VNESASELAPIQWLPVTHQVVKVGNRLAPASEGNYCSVFPGYWGKVDLKEKPTFPTSTAGGHPNPTNYRSNCWSVAAVMVTPRKISSPLSVAHWMPRGMLPSNTSLTLAFENGLRPASSHQVL